MGEYNERTGVNLVERFWVIDPITEVTQPADPDDVYFHIVAPDGVETTYHFPGAAEITHPALGAYVLEIEGGFLEPGIYRYWVEGIGTLDAVSTVKTFTILAGDASGTPPDAGIPIFGPCQTWISGDDINACGPDFGLGSESWRLDQAAADASTLLFELSGRQYPGVCERTVRPCTGVCGHWDYSGPLSPATATGWGYGFDNYLGFWRDYRGDRCGCNALSDFRLPGYPVRRILEVKIDGVVLPATDVDGFKNYRLDNNRTLTRMWGASGARSWPGCQNLAYDDDQLGTFSVTYEWGIEPPPHGLMAAAQLGRELWNACDTGSGADCALPSGVVQIVRQGVTINRVTALADLLRSGGTGIALVDSFIAMSNPMKMKRRPLIFSPDMAPYARKVG